jgi:ribonuclease Z
MRPTFSPRLVNGPFEDPGLYIPFVHQNRAILFDLGDLSGLTNRDLLKVSHVFVTHMHMDHFIGFDPLLRLLMGRPKTLQLYGPQGFLQNVEGKLAGYTWNLVQNYSESLILEVTEVRDDQMLRRRYRCDQRFRAESAANRSFSSVLLEEPSLNVSAIILDHGIPCLGYCLNERFHVNIRKERLRALGLEPGPWLQVLKESIYSEKHRDFPIEVHPSKGRSPYPLPLGTLADELVFISPGQKICYITDVGPSPENRRKIIEFVSGSDHLFVEAAFLDSDRDTALKKHHLTAALAGKLAGRAGVKQMTPFHFSPRYSDQVHLLQEEAQRAFRDTRPTTEVR